MSWVIVSISEPESPLFETFSRKVVLALNTAKYRAVPIMDWLVSLNRKTS